MFGHRAIHLSPFAGTQRVLGYTRAVPTARGDSGEEQVVHTWAGQHVFDVQPTAPSSLRNTKLGQTYAHGYKLTANGHVDIREMDRVVIDGSVCVVVWSHSYGGHTEAECGSLQPAVGGQVQVNQLVP